MDEKTRSRCEKRAEIVKAMAHPTRLFIIEELSRGRRCVCELTEMVGADTSTVSKHLSLLKRVGIIADEKEGLNVYYSLTVPCILNSFDCIDRTIRTVAEERLGAFEEEET
jgi:ArsR family transcriptional regulator